MIPDYAAIHAQEEAEELRALAVLERRSPSALGPFLTAEDVRRQLDAQRVPLELVEAVDDPILIGRTERVRSRLARVRQTSVLCRMRRIDGRQASASEVLRVLPADRAGHTDEEAQPFGKRRTPDRLGRDIASFVEAADREGGKRRGRRLQPLDAERVRHAMQTFGPHRVRAILDVIARDVDRVEVGDAAHRGYRVTSGLSTEDVDSDPNALDTVEDLSVIAELMSNRRRTDARKHRSLAWSSRCRRWPT